MSFLLTTEPWVPCITREGKAVDLGLRDTFDRAHDLVAVHDGSPLITLALHRLLLAFLHRVFGPPDLTAWKTLWARGRFEMGPLDAYFEAQRERLDLLHPERPFYQTRGLPAEYEPDGLNRLVFERSNYGAPSAVFQHRPRYEAGPDTLSLAEAARALPAVHAFSPGGLVKKAGEPGSATAGPLNRGACVLLQGQTLFETLMLNLLVLDPGVAPIAGSRSKDIPAWEQEALPRPAIEREPKRRPHGWIDLLTWQSRRLELVLTADGTAVRGVTYCVGQGLDLEGLKEPMLAHRLDEKRGLVPVDLSENRAVFRDCHAFIRLAEADRAQPPKAVEQVSRKEVRAVLQGRPQIPLTVLGMRGDQAIIKLTREEKLPVPTELFGDPERLAALSTASHVAEAACRSLRVAARIAAENALAPGDRNADPKDVARLADNMAVDRHYWASVAVAFSSVLNDIAADDAAAASRFTDSARRAALDALNRGASALGTSSRQLQAGARAEAWLRRSLAELNSTEGGSA